MRICIIDSGLNICHSAFNKSIHIVGKHHFFKDKEGEICHNHDIQDEIGHGTGVFWIINKYVPNSDYIIIKIFGENNDADEDVVLRVFEYIRNNIKCDILNFSGGIPICSRINEFERICNDIIDAGAVIVSAYDNDGGLSYPACFDNVIGVDISNSCFRPKDYFYITNSPINVRGFGYSQKLPSILDTYSNQKGASFTAAIISGIIGSGLKERNTLDPLAYLELNALACYSGKYEINEQIMQIGDAAIFPISKETKTLLQNTKILPFRIRHVYDSKYSGNVGKPISTLLYPGCNSAPYLDDMVIEPIEYADFSNVNTMIIGHMNMLQTASNNGISKEQLIRKALVSNINVYSFDNIGLLNGNDKFAKGELYYPSVSRNNVPRQRYGRLFRSAVPVLGIFGTSPKQGKFTLQLKLRRKLQNAGYKVANIGTEPSSQLFGFEETYPIGFNSTVSISGEEAVLYLNDRVHAIEMNTPDIIIVGSQSQTIPTGVESIGYMPIKQHELILGTCPDAYILVVNVSDDINYIGRTIKYLTSIMPSKVISLVVSPIIYEIEGGYQTRISRYIDQTEMDEFVEKLTEEYNINSYSLNDEYLEDKLQTIIEEFFS